MSISAISQQAQTAISIENFVAVYSATHDHTLIFMVIDWLEMEVVMHYKACCGGHIPKKHYKKFESTMKSSYPQFTVRWKYKQ